MLSKILESKLVRTHKKFVLSTAADKPKVRLVEYLEGVGLMFVGAFLGLEQWYFIILAFVLTYMIQFVLFLRGSDDVGLSDGGIKKDLEKGGLN